MRLSVQRLRWVLLAGAVLLLGVLAAFIGYGRYRALRIYRQIIARSGVSITHDSNGVTYSQSVNGRKVFTIRAKTESTLGNGKYALHNAELLLYDHNGHPADHISGSEIEYDDNEGIARAAGDVYMDIEPPQGLSNSGRSQTQPAKASPSAPVIHVRTSGLVYLRKLGIASTDQPVDFQYGGMHCTAVGAEFNSDQSSLRLLSNVRMDGLAHGKPIHLTAARADMDQEAMVANLAHPIVVSADRTASADTAILHLRKDGSIEQVQGLSHVAITDRTETIAANHLDAQLNAQSLPQTARLTGNVTLTGTDPQRPMHGSTSTLDVVFNAQGSPTRATASGGAKVSLLDEKTAPTGLARSLEGQTIIALLAPGPKRSSAELTEVEAKGSAHASGQTLVKPAKGALDASPGTSTKTMQVWADDLHMRFGRTDGGQLRPETLTGAGDTRLQQDGPLDEQEISRGDTLAVVFTAASGSGASTAQNSNAIMIASAVQSGNVTISDRGPAPQRATEPATTSTGSANRANYVGESQALTLVGDVQISSDSGSLMAPTVTLNQQTGDADASGGVQAAFQDAPDHAAPASDSAGSQPVTHVLAASVHFDHVARMAMFYGSDEAPARMWQGGSEVQAAKLTFDGIHRTFSARPAHTFERIHAVFVSNPERPKPGHSLRADSVIRVTSGTMDYNDLKREATFSGGVTIEEATGEVRGQHAVVFMTAKKPSAMKPSGAVVQAAPNPMDGSVDRVVVYGSVELQQQGRQGSGDELLYDVAKNSYVLTGTPQKPPSIIDAQQGKVTGVTLIFGDAGSTIVVAGDQGTQSRKRVRVRTETYIQSAKPERQ